jgi:competence protein ComEC
MLPPFFHQTPFFRLLLPFVAGIVVGFCFSIPAGYCILACVLSLMISGALLWRWNRTVPRRRGWLYGVFLNAFLLAAGVGTVSLQAFKPVEQAGQGTWLAVVTEPPTEKENSMKATVHVRANLTDEPVSACDEHVMTYFRKDSLSRRIRQGDLLVITAALNPVTNAGNPYEFDYRSYLARKHIGRSAFVESGNWQLLDSYAQGPLFNFSNRIRNSLLDIFKRAGLSGNELSVASALVLGYKADLDDTLRNAYAASGAMHVLAVSGLHVGIIYMVLTVILKLIPFLHRVKWLRALILLAALWLFALITGLSPSVMRAATMFSFIAAGEALRRRAYIYNSIAASAFILLLVNPANLFEVGFQLSYLAVIAIVFLHPFLYGLLSFKHRLADDLWNLTCVSLAAQAGTAPLALFYFHQFPMYFILSNFVVIPAATVIIYGALFLFLVSPVPVLLEAAGWLLNKFLYLVNFCIFSIEKLPESVITGIRFAGWEILFAYTLVAALSIWVLTKHKTALFATLAFIAFWATGATIRTGHDLRRHQLIVYHTQGNSLLQFVDGRENITWHAGRNPSFNASGFTENQRTAMHLNDSRFYHLDSALRTEKGSYMPGLYINGNFVQFAGNRLAVFTRNMPPQDAGRPPVRTDAAILSQNVNARISQIIESYRPGMVVLDASSSQARIDRWEKECAEAGVSCHRVDRDGAFILRSATGKRY